MTSREEVESDDKDVEHERRSVVGRCGGGSGLAKVQARVREICGTG